MLVETSWSRVCRRHPEAVYEADGLRTWAGAGAIRLYKVNELPEATVLLLERCRPGTQLRASPADEHDLVIAGLLRRLWMEPSPDQCFRPLWDMCDYWASRYEERSPAERSCFEAPQAKEGIRLLRELPRSGGDALLPHTISTPATSSTPNASRGTPSTLSSRDERLISRAREHPVPLVPELARSGPVLLLLGPVSA
jgi:hypothetical protein